ncbi:MAG: YbjN domain-containing protein [Oscillospiraceae bacterium]|nr:YbjN domain-containing protein [Oscillospiraceae bacterium]
MFQATQKIYDELKTDPDLKVFTEELDSASMVWLQFGLNNGGNYRIRFISRDDDNDVAVRIIGLVTVDDAQQSKVLPVLNKLNQKFRYAKFAMDDDGDINIEYDYLVRCPDPSASAREIMIRLVKIIDDAYPDIMRAMWA